MCHSCIPAAARLRLCCQRRHLQFGVGITLEKGRGFVIAKTAVGLPAAAAGALHGSSSAGDMPLGPGAP